jgi:hypothetical protein
MKIEVLPTGMIAFDNGHNFNQMRVDAIKSIIIFPPDDGVSHYDHWRVQVVGEGYIVFKANTREDAFIIKNTIDQAMGATPPMKFVQGRAVPITL